NRFVTKKFAGPIGLAIARSRVGSRLARLECCRPCPFLINTSRQRGCAAIPGGKTATVATSLCDVGTGRRPVATQPEALDKDPAFAEAPAWQASTRKGS